MRLFLGRMMTEIVLTTDMVNRVRRGARQLDKVFPGWERHIDLSRLDIGSKKNCVIGQLYGNICNLNRRLFPLPRELYGFFPAGSSYKYEKGFREECILLTREFRREIRLRLSGEKVGQTRISIGGIIQSIRNVFRTRQLSPG